MGEARSQTVDRVLAGQLCSGCGLCAGLSDGAIEMAMAPPGYARPRQVGPLEVAAERLIAAACPGAVVAAWSDAPTVDPLWGPSLRVATGFACDETVRFRGSSGGALTGLLIHALRSGLVGAVAHACASPCDATGADYTLSRTADEILAGAGSRYTATSPLADLQTLLGAGERIAFVGKPCDVSALRRLQALNPELAERIPLVLSFFCAGVPSRRAAEKILAAMGVPREEVVAFRYRGHGWPGRATATLRDGRETDMSYAESWGDFLSHEVQFRCKICPDAVGGSADIACGDAWYGDAKGYPDFAERDGRSLIMTRTPRGEALLASALGAGDLAAEDLPLRDIDRMQSSQADRKRAVRARVAALGFAHRPRPQIAGLQVDEAARQAGGLTTARNFLGTLRRIAMRRL